VCAVEDDEESCPGNKTSTVCFESSSAEMLQDTDREPNELDVAGSAEAVVNVSESGDAQAANVHHEPETNCQPLTLQHTASNPPEQHSAAELLSSAGNMLPSAPEVLNKKNRKKKQTAAGKKKSQKQNINADSMSTEATGGTWEVSSSDDSSKKNVVLIRRQHTSDVPDSGHPSSSQSQVSCETTCGTDDRDLSCDTDEVNVIQEQAASVSCEPIEGTANAETVDTASLKTDITADTFSKNVDCVPSTDDRVAAESQSASVRPKRRNKVTTPREACRKSQRCSSRRQEADGYADTTPVNTSAAEANTAGSCENAQIRGDGNALCLVSAREEVSQQQVMSSQSGADVNDQAEPVVSVSGSVISQTELSMASCDPAVLNSTNITAASVDDHILQPVTSVASTENSGSAPVSASESLSSELMDTVGTIDCSQDRSLSDSTYSHISSSACPGTIPPTNPIKHEIKLEQPRNNDGSSVAIKVEDVSVKHETNGTSCSYLAADFNASSCVSNDMSLLNTCLSGTFLETLVSPEEQLSRGLVVDRNVADGIDKEEENSGTPSSVVLVNTLVSLEGEPEEVCKMILEEVVANVVKETVTMSMSKESIESSLTDLSGHVSESAVAQNESDSTSGEIPLKKRRGRRVFADCQSNDSVTASHRSGEDRRDGISSLSSSHRRKTSSTSSRRHSPRGKKYVGAHTSVVGKLDAECGCVIKCW